MYIREIEVDGYGALSGLKLEIGRAADPLGRVTVLYGPNEAGKSTLLRFVRSMLYGFPTRKDPVERGEPVYGGRHGGRLVLADGNGREWRIERHAERGGEIRLRDDSGNERLVGQAEWQRLLLGGLSEKLFRQLFAVSLDELHELRTLQGEELGNFLYHAGLAGGASITEARRRIGAELDGLYRPKGSTQEMNRLLAGMKELETAIRQSRDGIQAYADTIEELERVDRETARIQEELPGLRMETAKLQGAFELREWWLKRRSLLEEIAELRAVLPDPGEPLLPEEASGEWAALRSLRSDLSDRLASEREELDSIRRQREQLVWDEEKAAAYPELDRLEALREGIAAKREERLRLDAERIALDDAVRGSLAVISSEWDEKELGSFGGLAADREQARAMRQAWEEAERAAATLQAELRRLDRQREVLLAEDRKIGSEGAGNGAEPEDLELSFGFLPRTKADLLQAWHQADDARRDYDRVKAAGGEDAALTRSERSKTGSGTPTVWRFFLAVASAAVAIVVPFLAGQGDGLSPAVILLSAVLLAFSAGFAVYAWNRRGSEPYKAPADSKPQAYRASRARMNEKLSFLLRDFEVAAAGLIADTSKGKDPIDGGTEEGADELWRRLREAVYAQIERWERRDRDAARSQELSVRAQEALKEREILEIDEAQQLGRLNELREQWRHWLAARKLPIHMSPDGAPELFAAAERGQAALRQRERLSERLHALDRVIGDFERAAKRHAENRPLPAGMEADAIVAVQWMYRESVQELAAKEEAERLGMRIESASAKAFETEEALTRVREDVAEWLRRAGAASESEMDNRLRIDERCRALRKEARDIQLRLESGRDAAAQAELYSLLGERDEASLAALIEERQAELAAAETNKAELLDRRGRLAQELERLGGDAELDDKRQRLGELQDRLEQLAERYAILALADKLIVDTKAIYEQEKQPEVLLRASRFFRQMTGGAYIRVLAPGDSKALLAETKDRTLLDSIYLSRGTQEQLYLAMRFALCDAASPEHPLPLLMDDLFVHFDEKRLKCALPVLEELGATRQVLLFTCHLHAAQAIASGVGGARLLTLGV